MQAMEPKKQPKTCGTCEYHKAEIFRDCACKDSTAYRKPTHPDAKACAFYKQAMTLEQRYQQLEQVAKEMLSFIERVEQTAYEEFREQLEALGVDVDG